VSADSAPPPLAGTRVLDFSLLLPGPACTLRLAWLGAEVVKVEPPGGDPARQLYGGGLWDLMNRGKRSVVLDL
jgi:alpha-methylacyl-CoA racemase